MKKIFILFPLLLSCSGKENTVTSNYFLFSSENCENVSFDNNGKFQVWTEKDGVVSTSTYSLNGKALNLNEGKGFSQQDKDLKAAYPASAFNPLTGKGFLSENSEWFPASARTAGLKKIIFRPASNYLQLNIYSDDSITTLYSLSIESEIPLCGEGDIAYYSDGRAYVRYSGNQGSRILYANLDSAGVPLNPGKPFRLVLPLPACIELDSLIVRYRLSEGWKTETLEFKKATISIGETINATVGRPGNIFSDYRNETPYSDIDWNKVIRVNTTSHTHCEDDRTLDNLRKHNIEFFTFSNYHPATPTYPAGEMKAGRRGLPVTDYPLVVNGVLQNGPFDWNEIVGSWADKLTPELKAQLPFKESTEKMFKTWIPETLEAPNAEHYSFRFDGKYYEMHMCCPGSAYCSGTFDAHDTFGTEKYGGFNHGTGQHWKTGIDNMVKGLIIPSGGGVTINHPGWSKLTVELICEILDYDARVLGIEILNSTGNDEEYWDKVLSTGRQCFGFCVPDHLAQDRIPNEIFGVNVLLVHSKTVQACLEAYRKGNFYGAIRGYGELSFTRIEFDGHVIHAATDAPAIFEVITDSGTVYTSEGTSIEYSPSGIFARVRATASDGCGEILYSQPFILKE